MLHLLKRHQVPIKVFFEHSLMVTYAFPEEILAPLLPPGLELDTHNGFGFLAAGAGKTKELRPSFLPAFCGQAFYLIGYRIFARFTFPDNKTERGLFVLRSDTDGSIMTAAGNLLTRYQFHKSKIELKRDADKIGISARSSDRHGDINWRVEIPPGQIDLPSRSPFSSWLEAERFAGPLQYTFDYEKETHSVITVAGLHDQWQRKPVFANSVYSSFIRHPVFQGVRPILASAFYVQASPYQWERGIAHKLT
ncbi:MAG: DUF2071 domain-containing protein [Candidatus Obscuribacterales bacterium]|nr:DUF2071 domain-containing protein [Candidatus Obscuribacterales bacterium]